MEKASINVHVQFLCILELQPSFPLLGYTLTHIIHTAAFSQGLQCFSSDHITRLIALPVMDLSEMGPGLDDIIEGDGSPAGLKNRLYMEWLNAAHKSTIMVRLGAANLHTIYSYLLFFLLRTFACNILSIYEFRYMLELN